MSLDGVNGFLDVESAALRAPQVGIANTNPQHILSVGSNLYVSGDSSDVLTVDGNVVCEGVKVGLIEITPSYDLEAVANVGNSTSNTILFTNPDTGIVATGNVSVGKTLTVDGIRITAAAEADVDLDAVVAAGPSTARSIQLIGATDSISPYTGTLTIGTNTGNNGGLGVAGNVHVGRGLYVRSNLEVGTANLFVNTVNSRVGIGKTNPDATLDVDGDAIIRGDLSVLGTTTTIDTNNLRVQDPIIELGKDNAGTGDLGLVMTRPTGSSNVAIIFDENADTLEIGYTDNDASATDITMVSTPLSVNINGDLSITSNLEVSGNINGDLSVTSNLEVGTANLFVDTVNSRVGIGTTEPVSGLTVFKDIESSNSFITERVLFRETWPNGLNSLVGDLGTWVVTNLNQQVIPSVETTPDGYGIVAFNGGTGVANGEFVSPAFDLSDYAIVDGNHQADDKRKTTTRVFMKFWLGTRQLDSNGEVLQVQFSPDNGTTWYTVATSQDRLSTDRFTMVSADLSPYILSTGTPPQAKIRFYLPWTVGDGDYIRIGRIWIHESDVPTNLGGMWLGAGGNIGIGTTNPVGVNGGQRIEGSSTTGFEYIATRDDSTLADGDFIGGYLFKNADTNGTEPHYAGMTAYANETFGRMDLRFFAGRDVYETDPTVPHMTLDQDGQLGIGTTNPGTALDVLGTIRVQTGTNDATGGEFSIDTNVGHIRRKIDGNGVSLTSYDDFQFYVNATGGSAEGGTQAMIIDNSGNVGIGISNPGADLTIVSTESQVVDMESLNNKFAFRFASQTATNNDNRTFRSGIYFDNDDGYGAANMNFCMTGGTGIGNKNLTIASTDAAVTIQRGSRNVGIGTTTPGYKLEVSGDIYASGNVTAYSDRRAKSNIEKIQNPLDKIDKISGYTYTMKVKDKDDPEKEKRFTGLIAQEVLEILPEAVMGSEENHYSLAYGNMAGLLVEAIKELSSELKTLKQKIC